MKKETYSLSSTSLAFSELLQEHINTSVEVSYPSTILEINLSAILRNFDRIKSRVRPGCRMSAIVKANAYGLGDLVIGKALHEYRGCNDFFVATLEEGINFKKYLKEVNVYILNGLIEEAVPAYYRHKLIPVLNTYEQLSAWASFAHKMGQRLPAVLHLDSGINRTGFCEEDAKRLVENVHLLDPLDIRYIMSHLANVKSTDPDYSLQQLQYFSHICSKLPPYPRSFIASDGTFLPTSFHNDLARIGGALYGIVSHPHGQQLIEPVLQFQARVMQVSNVSSGASIGYGATYVTQRNSRIATIASGYTDGFSYPLQNKGYVYFNGHPAPVIGRVSMDLTTVDITDMPPDRAVPGSWAEIIGPHASIQSVAHLAGTHPYDILLHLGKRAKRVYHFDKESTTQGTPGTF